MPEEKSKYVGFWKRVLSMILDGIILGIPAYILSIGLVFITQVNALYFLPQAALIVLTIYMDGVKGATPGKMILNMKIVDESGGVIGIPKAILRYIGKLLSALILGIGYFMIGWDAKKQGLHDKIAKTYVVYK